MNAKKDNKIDDNAIIKMLKNCGVNSIAMIQKNIDKDEIVRNKEINETITEEKALEMFFKDHKNKDKIVPVGLEMIRILKIDNII